nr:hypothetical protein KRP22_1841 [Phytophthora ramorum]
MEMHFDLGRSSAMPEPSRYLNRAHLHRSQWPSPRSATHLQPRLHSTRCWLCCRLPSLVGAGSHLSALSTIASRLLRRRTSDERRAGMYAFEAGSGLSCLVVNKINGNYGRCNRLKRTRLPRDNRSTRVRTFAGKIHCAQPMACHTHGAVAA